MRLQLVIMALAFCPAVSFIPHQRSRTFQARKLSSNDDWLGDIVPNQGGKIRGCSIKQAGESLTDWIITIDGVEADLGRFSEVVYKKVVSEAKQQQFQGFRPGTIPPHLEPTYRAYSMDECARETVMEAMEQNDIRPFTDARNELLIEKVSIPPIIRKGKKKKSKRRKDAGVQEEEAPVTEEPKWTTYDTMKEAINAGWKPGQSFSFVVKNVKGQKVLRDRDVKGASPLGLNY